VQDVTDRRRGCSRQRTRSLRRATLGTADDESERCAQAQAQGSTPCGRYVRASWGAKVLDGLTHSAGATRSTR
jgi:hypothetical protein